MTIGIPGAEELNHPKMAVVTFQEKSETVAVDLGDIDTLFGHIKKYNEYFSLGNMMARRVISLYEKDDSITPDSDELQQANAFIMRSIHAGLLEKVGLSLEPVSGKIATMIGARGIVCDGQIRINIADGDRFVSFIQALNPEHFDSTNIKFHLENLSQILIQQIIDHYNFGSNAPQHEVLQLFGQLEKIITEYKRLGLDSAANSLEEYLTHARSGDLPEFIKITKMDLLDDPEESFGPARWQRDCTPESLNQKWDETFKILDKLRNSPQSLAFYHKLLEHIKSCIDIAIADHKKNTDIFTADDHREVERILNNAKKRLEAEI